LPANEFEAFINSHTTTPEHAVPVGASALLI